MYMYTYVTNANFVWPFLACACTFAYMCISTRIDWSDARCKQAKNMNKKKMKVSHHKNTYFRHLDPKRSQCTTKGLCRSSAKRTSSQSSSSKSRQALPQPPMKSTRRRLGTHFKPRATPHHTYSAVPAKRWAAGSRPFFSLSGAPYKDARLSRSTSRHCGLPLDAVLLQDSCTSHSPVVLSISKHQCPFRVSIEAGIQQCWTLTACIETRHIPSSAKPAEIV